MKDLFKLILGVLPSLFKSRAKLEAEILILRQQINVLRRRAPKRRHLNNTDRFLFVWLGSPPSLARVGRPKVSPELRTLIGENRCFRDEEMGRRISGKHRLLDQPRSRTPRLHTFRKAVCRKVD